MTIDRLILEQLSDGRLHTADEIASTWGEDCRRVQEWLKKFFHMGLCAIAAKVDAKNFEWVSGFQGYPHKIREFLEKSPSRVSHF